MTELLQAAFAGANIIPTAFLAFVLLYWAAVIFGLLDLDFLDLETGLEADGISSVSWLNSALAFFNLGKVPLMVFFTFWALPFWVLAVLAYHYGHAGGWLGMLLLPLWLLAALFVAKTLTAPFVRLFALLEKEPPSAAAVIGQVCTVLLPANPSQMGQASVKTDGSPLLLNVKTSAGQTLQKGETALVISYNEEHKFYLIEPYETL
ncbi:MAG: hypothetical protein ACO1NZ_03145 [Adhaeribacter sp.]